jgi:hypothetical protein
MHRPGEPLFENLAVAEGRSPDWFLFMATAKVYIYKITADDGIAPCPQGAMLTLCVCNPAIRLTARKVTTWLASVPTFGMRES